MLQNKNPKLVPDTINDSHNMTMTMPTPTLSISLRHTLNLAVFLLVLLSSKVVADATNWLEKISLATNQLSYCGTFVYFRDGKVESMEVARRITTEGVVQEHLRSLNGSHREIVRNKDDVWYYMPDQHAVIHDYRQTYWLFPVVFTYDFMQLKHFYRFVEGDEYRIADRPTRRIDVVPKDAYRYGYSLWVDNETGLLLMSQLIGQQGDVIEQYLFINVEIGKEITDEQLVAVNDKAKLRVIEKNMLVITPIPIDDSPWKVTQSPDGYVLETHIRTVFPNDPREVEHLVYTDGLSSVSIFIKEIQKGQSITNALSQEGAIHSYRKILNNHQITVMGEVPAETVAYFARHLKF